MTNQEKRNRNIGLITSAGVHAALLLLFLFLVAWRAPNPPLPEFGIELNFGVDEQGGGDIQPETPPTSETTEEQTEETPAEEQVVEETETTTEPVTESQQESVVPVKEEKPKEVKPKETEKPKEEPKKEEAKPVEYKPQQNADTKSKTESTQSHGDDKNKAGDKGNPEGSLDAKALYGKQGGGGGGVSIVGFSGFEWPEIKVPDLPDESYGTYEFVVTIDSDGEVIAIKAEQRGLSIEAERKFQSVIKQLVFIPKNSKPSENSEGRITFKVVPH